MKTTCETCGGTVPAKADGTPESHGQWRVGKAGPYQSDQRCITDGVWSHRLPIANLRKDEKGIALAKKRSKRTTADLLRTEGLRLVNKGRYRVVPPTAVEVSEGAIWTLLYVAEVTPA